MIKLTSEQVDSVVEKFAGGAEWSDTDYINAVTFARAIEAEVLRLNGITEMTPEQKRAFTQDMIADMNGEIEG